MTEATTIAVPAGIRHMNHGVGRWPEVGSGPVALVPPVCTTTIAPGIARDIPCPCGMVIWRYAGDE